MYSKPSVYKMESVSRSFTSYLLATPSTTMKMHLGLLVVLAGLAMGQKGLLKL